MFEKLRRIRREKDVKVKEIVKILGLETEAAYYKKETGTVPFTITEAKKIAELLNEPVEEIFF